MKFTALLCDGDILVHRACAKAASKAEFDGILHWTVDVKLAGGWIRRELARYRERLDCQKVLIALGDRKANFRKQLCPTYKANRNDTPKPPGFAEVEANLRAHAKVYQEPRLEGDDMLGLLATKEPGRCIVSIDKDLRQVPGWSYNPDHDELVETSPEQGDYFHLVQTLTGDRVDGYPGCPGVGPVKAERILGLGGALGPTGSWADVVAAYEKAGQTDEQALLQARLARVLRQGDYDRKTKEIKLWTPD